ncbi:MAG: hypothetical protein Ct9H90mP13_13270 [Pseudomonadota bacterium]|nr:MAG: hypothetical protein Ct9H90mP13_13270 [Pseudomonadota bacterium]
MHARIYYTAESLGNLDVMHTEVYKAIHLDRKMLMDEDEIFKLFEKNGVSKEQFQAVLDHSQLKAKSIVHNA